VLADSYENAKYLLKRGALPNHKDAVGNTPMHLAIGMKSLPLVRLLDQYYADANVQNIDKVTPLEIAITENIRDIKMYLLSQKRYQGYLN
jgi:ankyrin repeat protein